MFIFHIPVETIGTGSAAFLGLPVLQVPHLRLDLLQASCLGPALTVAMLGAIESLMSAVVSDR